MFVGSSINKTLMNIIINFVPDLVRMRAWIPVSND